MEIKVAYTFTISQIKKHLETVGLQESADQYMNVFNTVNSYINSLNSIGCHFLTLYNDVKISDSVVQGYMNQLVIGKLTRLYEQLKLYYSNYSQIQPVARDESETKSVTYSGESKTMSEDSPQNNTIGDITTPFIKNNAESDHTQKDSITRKNAYNEYRMYELIEKFQPFITNKIIAIYDSVCEEMQTMY